MTAAKRIQATKTESGTQPTASPRRTPPRPRPRTAVATKSSTPPPLPPAALRLVTTPDTVTDGVEEITSIQEIPPVHAEAARAEVPEVPRQLRGRGVAVVWFVKTVGFFVAHLVVDGARAARERLAAEWARASERARLA